MHDLDRTQRSPYCPFCADKCQLPIDQAQDTADPFSLGNLLPAGTITVAVHDNEEPCPSACSSGRWLPFPAQELFIRSENHLFRQLAFLTRHLFLRATCALGASGRVVFVRIYLIPDDLPNICGRLLHRPESVVKEARHYMHDVLLLTERSDGLWDAKESCLGAPRKPFLSDHIDNRTMVEIYSDLPSPTLNPSTNKSTKLPHHVASGGTIRGLRTILYRYQRHSVAIMLDRELSIRCYLRPSTMSVLRECPTFSPSRSGILCEELGTGKTVIIISLILASAHQFPHPEESSDERPVLTPLAYNRFPSAEYARARERAGLRRVAIRRVPPLVEILLHYFSSSKFPVGYMAYADELQACHLWPIIQANTPFYHQYNTGPDVDNEKRLCRRSAPNLPPRTMYLSSATLVIVPLALIGHWKAEIDKHCHDSVRYLIVRRSMALPHARKLASDYELIVMSDTRFRAESRNDKAEKLHNLAPCTCPYLTGYRIPDCRCSRDREVTPLLQVRWKRLVIDEGHTTSNIAATINEFVRRLSIQHKWIVTGTPTSNILGLQLEHTIDEHEASKHVDSAESASSCPFTDTVCPCSDDETHVRIWGGYDRLNLSKLGIMIGDFLAVPPFYLSPKCFTDHVLSSLCDRRGPRPGAINVLSQIMQMVMVRHRIEEVENEVPLPPMQHEIIYLDMDYYALKSYNAMQAGLVINAIDSERQGPDYLFHPTKAKALQATITNSLQGLFWSSSDILYNVDQICEYADEYLAHAVERKITTEEMDLLRQALKHAASAAKDKIWRAMQRHADVPFKVSGLDPDVFKAWTRRGLCDDTRTIDIMHPDRLVNLRSLVRKKPLVSLDELVEEGNILDSNEITMASVDSREAKPSTNQTKEMAKELKGTIEVLRKHLEKMDNEELEDHQSNIMANQTTSTEEFATRTSLLSGVEVGSSLSSKLNYIIFQVQKYSDKEKFLIFSDSVLTLFHVGEALSLFEIKYLRYTNQEQYLLREQSVLTFETSDVYRVLLVELKLGARGLNLISASRVIFCAPVWHPDVESQAIKRVHRIGQTRPVTIKTLAIRSTPEEAMIARRQYLRTGEKIPNMTTESGMRQYLEHPKFLSESTYNMSTIVLPLGENHATLVDVQHNSSRCEDDMAVGIIDAELDNNYDGDAPARKKIRFEELS